MNRRFAHVVAVIVLALALVALTACGPKLPDRDPDIRGSVTAITPGTGGTGAIMVEAGPGGKLAYDRASVSVRPETEILAEDGTTILSFDDLTNDAVVEVWFTGAVAESYPVQATAQAIRVITIR